MIIQIDKKFFEKYNNLSLRRHKNLQLFILKCIVENKFQWKLRNINSFYPYYILFKVNKIPRHIYVMNYNK